MGWASIACVSLAAVSFYAGLSFATRFFLSHERSREDLLFSGLCFVAGLYQLASARLYLSESAQDGATWQNYQFVLLLLAAIFLLRYVSLATGGSSWKVDAGVSTLLLAGMALSLWNPDQWMWTDRPMIQPVTRFGIQVVYYKMEHGALRELMSLLSAVLLGYIGWKVLAYWRAGQQRRLRPMGLGVGVLTLGLLSDGAVAHGFYTFFYLSEYAFSIMILCMSFSLLRTQVRVREALTRSEDRYRSFLRDFQGIAFRVELDYTPHFMHGAVERITGYTESDFRAGAPSWPDLILQEDRDKIQPLATGDALASGQSDEREYRIRTRSGAVHWIRELARVVPCAESAERLCIQGAFYNITARKEVEVDLKRKAAAVEAAAESIVVTDADHKIQYVNPAFEALSGYHRTEILGKTPAYFKSGKQSSAFYQELRQSLASGKVWRGHFVNRKKDGSLYEEKAVISPVRDDLGKIVNYVAVKRDITHEEQLETELRQSEKMGAIGKLAGRVAHDFTNILVVIQGNVGLIHGKMAPDAPEQEYVESILQACRRACQLTTQLLAFSHRQNMSLRHMDLCKSVRGGVDEMLARTIDESIRLATHVCEGLCTIQGDPDHIEQIIVHLAVNACDAMTEGGVLTVETMRMTLSSCEIAQSMAARRNVEILPGPYAVLFVSDSGVGIPDDVLPNIFDPFFSTKGNEGTSSGLGLTTVYDIAEQHHGFMDVFSQEGTGTCFAMYFPLVGRGKRELEAREAERPVPPGSEKILLAFPGELYRNILAKDLQDLGYSVLEAEGLGQGLDLARQLPGPDLLIAEWPGLASVRSDVYKEIQRVRPSLKTLWTTGFPPMHMMETDAITEQNEFLHRPYRYKDVARTVRNALAGD